MAKTLHQTAQGVARDLARKRLEDVTSFSATRLSRSYGIPVQECIRIMQNMGVRNDDFE